jgi:Cytochrome c7 and related cytochrome c
MFNSSPLKYLNYFTLVIFLTYGFTPLFSAPAAQPGDTVSARIGSKDTATARIGSGDSLAGNILSADTVITNPVEFKAEEITLGERLFFGLVYTKDKSVDCAACHNTRTSDTINWNPDAVEISKKYAGKSVSDLTRVLLNPTGQRMAQVHKNFKLAPEDIRLIKAYMDRLPAIGLIKDKPVLTNLILFLLASLLFLFSATDLIITKWLKMQWINLLILLITTLYISWSLVVDAIDIGRSPGYSPDQPIKFSHAIHAGQNGTACIYCHSYAPYSKMAGIPPENVCMNCHLIVRSGARTGAFEIAKILSAYENKKPVKWVKVHNLPDHVFFSHAQHVGAGGVICSECHGQVEKMDRITQEGDLAMGWCINCHRTRNVKFEENIFYTQYRELSGEIQRGASDSITVERIGGTQCMKCHY